MRQPLGKFISPYYSGSQLLPLVPSTFLYLLQDPSQEHPSLLLLLRELQPTTDEDTSVAQLPSEANFPTGAVILEGRAFLF